MDEIQDLEVARHLEFHGVAYVVTVSVAQQQLHVQVEVDDALSLPSAPPASPSPLHAPQAAASSSPAGIAAHEWTCWTGSFPSAYVEELTRKTGNFKRFSIFVNMLLSALAHRSDAVFVDLLTTNDLELYRKRKFGNGAHANSHSALDSFSTASPVHIPQTASGSSTAAAAKRYLILTYAVEFDRVHYPLPLTRAQAPTPAILQRTIRRLRQALAAAASAATAPSSSSSAATPRTTTDASSQQMRDELTSLREENRCLKHALAAQLATATVTTTQHDAESPIDLQRELAATLQENKELIAIYQQLRESSATEIARLHAANQQLRAAHASSHVNDHAIERLEQQLERERHTSRRKLHDSSAVVEETLAQLQRMKTQCDDVQLKNRELLRQLAIARARAGANPSTTTLPNRAAAAAAGAAATRSGSTHTRTTARDHSNNNAAAQSFAARQRRAAPIPFNQLRHDYNNASDDDDGGSNGHATGTDNRVNAASRRQPFRRFDPTAYQQERQRRLRAARSPSPHTRADNGASLPHRSYLIHGNGGYTSDSSAGGYSSAGSNDSNRSTRRGRSRTRVSAEHQRAVVDRLSSPKRAPAYDTQFKTPPPPPPPPPSMRTGGTRMRSQSPGGGTDAHRRRGEAALPPPHPPRRRQQQHNHHASPLPPPPPSSSALSLASGPAKPRVAANRKRASTQSQRSDNAAVAPPARASTALLGDTTTDSFSDIDERLNALQQFLKQAKQGSSGSNSSTTATATSTFVKQPIV